MSSILRWVLGFQMCRGEQGGGISEGWGGAGRGGGDVDGCWRTVLNTGEGRTDMDRLGWGCFRFGGALLELSSLFDSQSTNLNGLSFWLRRSPY